MSLASLSFSKINYLNDFICKRARIETGPFCNYKCTFCYYKDRLDQRIPLKSIYNQIDLAKQYGMTSLDFSGGESAIEPNWFKILEYGGKQFNYMSCLSHGGKFADIEFLKKSQEYGLKEILFSVHGQTAEIHDNITQRKGSFKKIVRAIKNAHKLGIIVRINCTITLENYKIIDIKVLEDMNPLQLNFIIVNYWGDNKNETNRIDYKDMSKYLHKYLNSISTIKYVNVRYIPFCYMKGYEKYIINYMQLPYDLYDWNIAFYPRFQQNRGCILSKDLLKDLYNTAELQRNSSYQKPLNCLKCKYFYICDGIEKDCNIETKPIEGDKIHDPLHHCRNNIISTYPEDISNINLKASAL